MSALKLIRWVSLLLIVLLVSFVIFKFQNRDAKKTIIAGSEIAPSFALKGEFDLIDENGKTIKAIDFKGPYHLIYFGYTYCPDICPTELNTLTLALEELGAEAHQIQPLFISVDPERDTPELLKEYVKLFHPKLKGYTGTQAQITKIAKAFNVYYTKFNDEASNDYLIDHSTFFYLLNPEGKLVTMYRRNIDKSEFARSLSDHLSMSKK